MFLVPALVGKAIGPTWADFVLLIQNSVLLGTVLALGSILLDNRRERLIALATITVFSGMDIIGAALHALEVGGRIPGHLESWAGLQFSSHITQAFWVPQHALAGWIGALLFLLWRRGAVSLGVFMALLPWLLLLSPLGAIGVLPFAAYAFGRTALSRRVRPSDFVLPAATTLIALPSIGYLSASGGSVGARVMTLPLPLYLEFIALEVLPFLVATLALAWDNRERRQSLLVAAACLLLMPFVQVGESTDFGMRASIAALAVLAFETAVGIAQPSGAETKKWARPVLILALAVGAVTPGFEVARAFAYLPSPRVHCSLPKAWDNIVDLAIVGKATYFSPVSALPEALEPRKPAPVQFSNDPAQCWSRPWRSARSFSF
jgi:hypothetical protein